MAKISLFFKEAKPFAQLVGLFFLFIIGFIIATGIQMLVPIGDTTSPQLMLTMQGVSQLFTFLLPALLFAVLYSGNVCGYYHFDMGVKKWVLGFVAIMIVLLLLPVVDYISLWNESWDLGAMDGRMREMTERSQQLIEQMLSTTGVWNLLLQLVVVALVPAVCEELFFRGALQQIMDKWFGNKHVAVIVAAIVFSLAHGDIYGLVPRFMLGVVLGYLFVRSGSILVNICAHFANNAVFVVLYYLYNMGELSVNPSEHILIPWGTALMCMVGSGLLFTVYFVGKRQKESEKAKQ